MKTLSITFILMLLSYPVAAQDYEKSQISVLINTAIPTLKLKQAVDNRMGGMGVGLGINGLINPKGNSGYSPVFFGGDFSWVGFGSVKQKSPSSPTYKTTFNYYGLSGLSRLFLNNRSVGFVPFIDGQMGVQLFNTRTMTGNNIFKLIFDDQAELIHSTNYAGLSYGLGFGFYTRKARAEKGNLVPSTTARLMYHWGNKTRYVKRESVSVNGGSVYYETGYTHTNLIMIQFGILMR
jgi:hypothetical protein